MAAKLQSRFCIRLGIRTIASLFNTGCTRRGGRENMLKEKRKLMDEAAIVRTLRRMASQILEHHEGTSDLCLVGIRTRGVDLAKRLGGMIEEKEKTAVPIGEMDITLYRDDVFQGLPDPQVGPTRLPFAVRDKNVVLVDDVLYTGRTVRAALDELMDFGRPRKVELAVLVDRGWRELPIQADFVGITVDTDRDESVQVLLEEQDGREEVVLRQKVVD
jgi:pyrimidine operon attenuation protein/uracil phosphoribosyltransferase